MRNPYYTRIGGDWLGTDVGLLQALNHRVRIVWPSDAATRSLAADTLASFCTDSRLRLSGIHVDLSLIHI